LPFKCNLQRYSVAFAPDAAGLYVGCADHNLRVFA
jgi:hypothetical protein